MAYYLYKKIRDRHARTASDQHLFEIDRNAPNHESIELSIKPSRVSNDEGAITTSVASASAKEEQRTAQREMQSYRWRLIIGLFCAAIIQSLNTTMIAGALPFIASSFDELAQLNWIVAAYNLTAAAFIPLWAQLADIFGRYAALQAATLIMILGSAICGGAPTTNYPMLLAGRGLQGLGSAGMLILEKTILSDKVSLRENAKSNSLFTIVIGIGYSIGPVIGGALTSVSWRWVFIINIPIAVLSLVLFHIAARPLLLGPQDIKMDGQTGHISSSETFLKRLATIDFGGQFLFLFGMGLFVLALTWAGASYSWSDNHVIVPLTIGVVLILGFLVWEYLLVPGRVLTRLLHHQRAMIPFRLLISRNAGILMYINLITGMSMYAVLYFLALYFTIVQGYGSSKAGADLLYYIPGLGGGAYTAMFVCNRWPRQTWPPLALGTVVEATGVTLLAAAVGWNHLPTIYGMLALTGFGTGLRLMPGTLHGVGYYRNQIASIVALMSFSNSFGGTLASTIMLNIFNNLMSNAGVSFSSVTGAQSNLSSIAQLSPSEQSILRDAARRSIQVAFYAITSFLWLGIVAMAFLGNVSISKSAAEADVHEDGETDGRSLTKGSYIGSLFKQERETEAVDA